MCMPIIEPLETAIKAYNNVNPGDLWELIRKNINVFFIKKSALDKIDFSNFRLNLQKTLSLSTEQCLQVIGDSNPFSEKGHRYSVKLLFDVMKRHAGPILYGFTSNNNGGANGIVAECLEKDRSQSNKVVANIVYPESITAISEWGCTYSEAVKNYLVVVDPQGCRFGDDIMLSDNLAEKLVCFDGGVISFCQVVNTLIYHDSSEITVVYGLRDKENRPWFSAAEIISQFKKASCIEDLIKINADYLKNKPLYDPSGKQPTAKIIKLKEEQINTAFQKLIEAKGVLQKLQDITVTEYMTRKLIKTEFFQSAIGLCKDLSEHSFESYSGKL